MEKEYLVHFGIKGQKWGQRRFQNEDGSYTEEGRKRYLKNIKNFLSKHTATGRALSAKGDRHYRNIRAIGNMGATISTKRAIDYGKYFAASFAAKAYTNSGNDPKVKTGAMIVGNAVNLIGTLKVADLAIATGVQYAKDNYAHYEHVNKKK